MDDREVGKLWDGNADAWTLLARQGYDIYRDYLNTPWFLGILPDVSGLHGIDIGCGEGNNTRLVARRGATMVSVDISPRFVAYASASEAEDPLGIRCVNAAGGGLPFVDECLDFATAFMSLMDMADQEGAIREVYRVLRPGGSFHLLDGARNPPGSSLLWPLLRVWLRQRNQRFEVCTDEQTVALMRQAGFVDARKTGEQAFWLWPLASYRGDLEPQRQA